MYKYMYSIYAKENHDLKLRIIHDNYTLMCNMYMQYQAIDYFLNYSVLKISNELR